MLAHHIDVVETIQQHLPSPVSRRKIVGNILAVNAPGLVRTFHHIGHGAPCNQFDRRIDLAHFFGEEIVLQLELRKRNGAHLVVAPRLVAYAPELHVVRLRMSISSPPFAHGRGGRAIRVFNQFARGPGISKACVDRDVRVNAEQPAEREKLIGAHVVGLHSMPHGIKNRRPLVDVAHAVAPLIRGNKIAAGKTQNPKPQLFKCGDNLRPKAFNVVGGHE